MKYLVTYTKIANDKKLGSIMTGIYIGGIADNKDEADKIATHCVSKIQGGLIIPKITPINENANLLNTVKEIEKQFDRMADAMLDNEQITKS